MARRTQSHVGRGEEEGGAGALLPGGNVGRRHQADLPTGDGIRDSHGRPPRGQSPAASLTAKAAAAQAE